MKIELLASSIGGEPAHQYLITYLVNDILAIDAGGLGFWRGPEDQCQIRHVFLSHSHIDHIASLPIFLENVFNNDGQCPTIHASAVVWEALQRDVFNDRIWPDFIALSSKGTLFLRQKWLEAGQTLEVAGLTIEPLAMNHSVPALGFLLRDAQGSVLVVSDTGPCPSLWQRINQITDLHTIFLEASFPNEMAELARISGHLTPAMFAAELGQLQSQPRIIAVHIKARYRKQVIQQLAELQWPRLEIGDSGKEYRCDG